MCPKLVALKQVVIVDGHVTAMQAALKYLQGIKVGSKVLVVTMSMALGIQDGSTPL